MWIPFAKQLNSAFESDRQLARKLVMGVLAGVAVGANLLVAGLVTWLTTVDEQDGTLQAYISLSIGAVVLTIAIVPILVVKDVIRKREERGGAVNPFLRLLFGSGYGSLAIWISVISVGAFIFAMCSV